jgi:hypothetical protein
MQITENSAAIDSTPMGFEIRFVDLSSPDSVAQVSPDLATHIALYKRGADGLAEWVCDYDMTTRGVDQLAENVRNHLSAVLRDLNLGDRIARGKP